MTDTPLEFYNIPNYIGYKINKIGEIYSDKSKRLLTQNILNGYKIVKFLDKVLSVHRLVALTFLPKPEGKDIVNHKNSNKLDNRLENLEWVTQKENTAAHGKQIYHPKKVIQYDMDDNLIATFESLIDAGNAIGFTPSAISKAVLGINSSAGGFKWKYAEATNTLNIDLSQGKKIVGFEKYYVLPCGNIYNSIRKTYIKPIKNESGYCYVSLCNNGIKKNMYIQRIVATHFILSNDINKTQVNHKNKVRHDNRIENLEWVTPSENVQHARSM